MARLVTALVARRGVVDKYTGQVSAFDLVEAFHLQEEPAKGVKGIVIDLAAVIIWTRSKLDEPEKRGMKVVGSIVGPHGKRTEPIELEVRLDTSMRMRNLFHFASIPYDGFGEYRFEAKLVTPNEKKGARSLRVKIPFWVELAPDAKSQVPS